MGLKPFSNRRLVASWRRSWKVRSWTMVTEDLFSVAIGLVPPWLVDHVTFTVEEKRLDLHINFPQGCRFRLQAVTDKGALGAGVMTRHPAEHR